MSLGEKIVSDMESLVISEGRFRGEKMRVLDWQALVSDEIDDRETIALSMARGNGKSAFIAALCCSALRPDGALFVPRGEIVLVASSLNQARVIFRHIYYFIREEMEKSKRDWRRIDNSHQAQIEYKPTGTVLKAIGSDPTKAHGLAPSLIVCDEGAKWQSGGREMYIALDTSRGKQVSSKLIAIGTRPDKEDHWFSELLSMNDDNTFSLNYCAEKGDDDFAEETIRKANPSYDALPDLQEVLRKDAVRARDGGSFLSAWRALRLNMGTPEVSEKEMLIAREDWEAIITTEGSRREGPVSVAIDLGGGTSMSAIAFYFPVTGWLEAYGAFPAQPALLERGKRDNVGERYVKMKERGEVFVYPGKATNNVKFLNDMFKRLEGHEILGISADSYKPNDVRQALLTLGMNPDELLTFRRVGSGPEGGEDVRAFQREVLDAHMCVAPNLALESGIAESVLERGRTGEPTLKKSRHKGRIDVIQAAILAVGMGYRWRVPSESPGVAVLWSKMMETGEPLVGSV